MSIATIDPDTLRKKLDSQECKFVIDVRTPGEFSAVHLQQAVNIPLDDVSFERIKKSVSELPDELVVVCQSGARSKKACEKLAAEGLKVVSVDGGTAACVRAGLQVVRGAGVIGIERQVRIAAGSLVLTGAALGLLVHPAFYGLSAFIGGGLVFAGVTDWCGMGLLLAKMPWNQGSASTCNN